MIVVAVEVRVRRQHKSVVHTSYGRGRGQSGRDLGSGVGGTSEIAAGGCLHTT
jgi:hypothetical protein